MPYVSAQARYNRMDRPLRYIDLFCGLGAFHTAFPSSQFQCVFACDIDEGIRRVYKENYGMEPAADIRAVDASAVPNHDILCAGFPCQPFSIAGNGDGFRDTEKGNLFYEILRILDAKHPPMCILENVKNLQSHDGGTTYKTIETAFTSRGYWLASQVIDASTCGSPQARERIFMVATKHRAFAFPTPNSIPRTVADIVDPAVQRHDLDPAKYTIVAKPPKARVDPTKPHAVADVFPIPTPKKQAVLDEHARRAAELRNQSLRATNDTERTRLAKEADAADAAAQPKGGRQGERVYSPAAVGITVCASSGGPGAKTGLYKIGDRIRRLTVQETLGMFGFPRDYKFGTTGDEDALFYLGNSIVVNVISTLVPAVREYFRLAEVE